MKVLHVANIGNNKNSGTHTVIPEYIKAHQKINPDTFFLNCNNESIKKLKNTKNVFELNDKKPAKILAKINPDIVVMHELYCFHFYSIYKYCKTNGIPYILIPHGCITKGAQHHKYLKKAIFNKLIFNKILKNANKIQYLSEKEKNDSFNIQIDSFVLGNGINCPRENLYLKQSIKDRKNLVYIGRINFFHKGLDRLVRACALIRDFLAQNKIIIDIYGPDEENTIEKILNMLKEYKLENIIKIHNGIYGGEKRDVICKCKAFIQTSNFEGQPMSIIEAMSYGAPVIATTGTGMTEIKTSHSGIFCENSDEDVANAIKKIFKGNDEQSYSSNAHRFAKENFDWSTTANKQLELLAKTKS